nr:MAG TPA: hypothetical protein [Bacteriophage sp.]
MVTLPLCHGFSRTSGSLCEIARFTPTISR